MPLLRREMLALLASSLGLPAAARAGAGPWLAGPRPDPPENERGGTTDWLLVKVQPVEAGGRDDVFRRRRRSRGSAPAPASAGRTADVFVSTDPPARYRADVYRMGYYGGKGGRHVRTVGPLEGKAQPTPSDGPKDLIECRWEPGITLDIPADWPSGVYLGKLTKLDDGLQAYVVFIVRDDRPADLLFQCSDLTWQAYNRWPAWRSLYDWKGNKWHTDVGDRRRLRPPVLALLQRPALGFNPLTNGSGEFLLWEFPLAFWLEKEGYDVTYISNLDTHADPDGLLRAKGFLSVGHDEYWTREMFDNVRRARDAGVGLAFLSGNSVYHRIDLSPGGDGRPHRVFGRVEQFADEQELMGATSYGVGMGDWVCRKPDHWLFAGTGMKEGDRIPQLVGWEYHGFPIQRGGRPRRGRHGRDEADGGPALRRDVYTAPKGNVVFNAATCWWSMVLSKPPGFENPPNKDFSRDDPRVQRMTKNLLDRIIAGP